MTPVQVAQALQARREKWIDTLKALPGEKVQIPEFPYASMQHAVSDGFARLVGGEEEAFKLMIWGYKTKAWRKGAEKNRNKRDELAEVKKEKKAKDGKEQEAPVQE